MLSAGGGTDPEAKRSRRGLMWRTLLIVAAIAALFSLGGLLRAITSEDGGRSVAVPPSREVQVLLDRQPQTAALVALADARLHPSAAAEMTMLDVAVRGKGLERVVETGAGEVTSAAVLDRVMVTSDDDRRLRVWSRGDGTLLGEAQLSAPIVALADGEYNGSLLAALDRDGAVEVVDVTDPEKPRVDPLAASLADGARPLAVAFSEHQLEIVALGADGQVVRVDTTTGRTLSRGSLGELRGRLPWRRGEDRLHLTAAKFIPADFEDDEGLLVATTNGAVADLDLGRGQGKTVVEPGVAPGRVLSLDRDVFGEPDLALGTSNGLVVSDEYSSDEGLRVERGLPVTGVNLEHDEDLWEAGPEGVQPPSGGGLEAELGSGPRTLALNGGFAGIAAIQAGGVASVLGPASAALSMEAVEATPALSFMPDGLLLVAKGYDANHIEELAAVAPRERTDGDEYEPEEEIRHYRPDPEWWPDAEDPESLFVNDVESDDEYVVAGGQDPTGRAAVLVWDAKSGKPLHRLSLGTGGIDTALPSIVAEVLLLPERHEIAAYSAAQELVAIWSTDTWELESSIPVGPIADLALSPDQKTIVALGLGEDSEGYAGATEKTKLIFIDVEAGTVGREASVTGVSEASFSPDGNTLALAGPSGFVEFRSPDGGEQVWRRIALDGSVEDLSWRPDGAVLAIAESDGVVLADPESRTATAPLPEDSYRPPRRLSWSPDGELLATVNDAEEGEGPGPASVWTLGRARLEQRMCELAGKVADAAFWRRFIDPNGEPRLLCRPPRRRGASSVRLGDASDLDSPDLVFQRDDGLFAASTDGNTARVGWLDRYPYPPPAYDWSRFGVAWSSPVQISVLAPGDSTPRSWPCACSGVAWDGRELVSVAADGRALVRIDPETGSIDTEPLPGLPPYSPTLLGVVAHRPVIAGFEREPDRSTFSLLFVVESDGTVRRLPRDAHGTIYRHATSSSPRRLAFISGLSSGVCYSTATVGLVEVNGGRIRVRILPSALGGEAGSVRSAQVAADGSVSATFTPIGCDEKGGLEDNEPPGERYTLEGDRWRSTGEQGYDVQGMGQGLAMLALGAERGAAGRLAVTSDEEERELAGQANEIEARP